MRYWVCARFRCINGDSTFGVTFQDEALVDLINKHTKDRRLATVTVPDYSEEAESDCDDGSEYDAEDDDDWVCAPRHSKNRNTTSSFFPQEEILERMGKLSVIPPRKQCWYHRFLPRRH
jgi:hypothetical protein